VSVPLSQLRSYPQSDGPAAAGEIRPIRLPPQLLLAAEKPAPTMAARREG